MSIDQLIADCGSDPQRLSREIFTLGQKLEHATELCSQIEAKLCATQQELQKTQEELAIKEALLREAEAHIAELKRQLFGPKADKLTPEQEEQLKELAGDLKDQAQRDPPLTQQFLKEEKKEQRRRKKRGRRSPPVEPVELEVERIILEPDQTCCGQCQAPGQCIGEVITVEYDWIPAKLVRREIIRRKYAKPCGCSQGAEVVIAPLPERLVPQSRLGLGLAVYILLSRFDDHLSYYTLERIFWERHKVVIPRQQMVQWVEKIAFWLLSLYHLIWQELKNTGYLQIDETPVKVLDPEVKGKAAQGNLWLFSNPQGDVYIVFDPSRGHHMPLEQLKGFEGTIQADGYSVYKTLDRKLPGLRRIGCLAHARRKFYTALQDSVTDAVWFIAQIRQLYRLEDQAENASPEERLKLRRGQAAPIWRKMKHKADKLVASKTHLPQSAMGKALRFFLAEYTALVGYLRRPEFRIDNNLVENDVRPAAVGRKRWLFIGHPNAGWRSAVIYTIIQSARRRGLDPQEYLTDVLSRLPNMKNTELHELLPGNWKPLPKEPQGASP